MNEEYKPEQVSMAILGGVQQAFDENPQADNAATRLELARHLLASVEETLNDTFKVCDGCGSSVRESFGEWQAAEALRAAQTRITKASQCIAGARLKEHYGVKTFTELGELGETP